jgi:hypothetical protein
MSKIMRALLLSALATGVATVVVSTLRRPATGMAQGSTGNRFEVDADTLSEEERRRLTDELDAML